MQVESGVAKLESKQSLDLSSLSQYARRFGLPAALLVMIGYFAFASDVFLTAQNFRNVALQASALAAVSFGQAFVILNSDLDLSVGSTVAFVSIVASLAMVEYGVTAGVVAGLVAGGTVGFINGIVVTRFRVMPFIATLAMLSIAHGLALNISSGIPVTGLPLEFTDLAFATWLGIPVPFVFSLLLLAASFFVLQYTLMGRNIYAVGGNSVAARLSGILVHRARVISYIICGMCAAVAALILTARVGSGQPTLGASLALESVAAVVLGGVSLFGGRGAIGGVAVGVAFVSILSNGLNLLNVSSYTQMMVVGGALIAAVAVDQALATRR